MTLFNNFDLLEGSFMIALNILIFLAISTLFFSAININFISNKVIILFTLALVLIALFILFNDINFAIPGGDDGFITRPAPGVRCPTCAANGQEIWVLPGKACAYCGTTC